MQTAATWGVAGSPGSGAIALAHIDRTLPSVSAPSSVVRSIMLMAVSIAQAFEVVLMERVPNPAARESAPTRSTPGSPCSHVVNEALVRAPTPSKSRARALVVTSSVLVTSFVAVVVTPDSFLILMPAPVLRRNGLPCDVVNPPRHECRPFVPCLSPSCSNRLNERDRNGVQHG